MEEEEKESNNFQNGDYDSTAPLKIFVSSVMSLPPINRNPQSQLFNHLSPSQTQFYASAVEPNHDDLPPLEYSDQVPDISQKRSRKVKKKQIVKVSREVKEEAIRRGITVSQFVKEQMKLNTLIVEK